LVIIFIIINVVLISKLSNCQKQKQQVINLTNNTNIVEIIKSKISLELLCSNQKIENIKLVSTDNREYLFNKLIGESPKLVFFFSMLNCNSCIERELERIRQIEKQIGKDNIIILAADFEDYALSAYAGTSMPPSGFGKASPGHSTLALSSFASTCCPTNAWSCFCGSGTSQPAPTSLPKIT
jgi:hypothetical protein